jgi:hypothetical protein
VPRRRKAQCVPLSNHGVYSASEFAALMLALISDLINGRISPQVGNAVVNASGKLLKIVEMQHRYGNPTGDRGYKELALVPPGRKSNANN